MNAFGLDHGEMISVLGSGCPNVERLRKYGQDANCHGAKGNVRKKIVYSRYCRKNDFYLR
jgi:hypothetical protein